MEIAYKIKSCRINYLPIPEKAFRRHPWPIKSGWASDNMSHTAHFTQDCSTNQKGHRIDIGCHIVSSWHLYHSRMFYRDASENRILLGVLDIPMARWGFMRSAPYIWHLLSLSMIVHAAAWILWFLQIFLTLSILCMIYWLKQITVGEVHSTCILQFFTCWNNLQV
jgi:hypothetical protein